MNPPAVPTFTDTAPTKLEPVALPGYPLVAGPFRHLVAEHHRLSNLRWQNFQAWQLEPTIGAEITGIDITKPLTDDAVSELRQALHDYKVIFFRDQHLTPSEHLAFARRFGPLDVPNYFAAQLLNSANGSGSDSSEVERSAPSNIDRAELVRFEKGSDAAGFENLWHHDYPWREHPSMGAVLHALVVPSLGGDTLFADMYAAYDALDGTTKEEIENLVAVHDYTYGFARYFPPEQHEELRAQHPPVRHPVVCTHPVTGRRHLYVNRSFVSHIEGLSPDKSRELVDRLCRQADCPEHQCRFRWSPDAVAFWDNQAVQHYAASDYWPAARVTERVSIAGPRPTK